MTFTERNAMQMGRDSLELLIERFSAYLTICMKYRIDDAEAMVEPERNALSMMDKVLEGGDDDK